MKQSSSHHMYHKLSAHRIKSILNCIFVLAFEILLSPWNVEEPSGPRSVQKSASSQFVNSVWNDLSFSDIVEGAAVTLPLPLPLPLPLLEWELETEAELEPELDVAGSLDWPRYLTTQTVGEKDKLWLSLRRVLWVEDTSDCPLKSNL